MLTADACRYRLHQMALNSSNGCRHSLQNQIDLHAVEPNTLLCCVSCDLQYGQRIAAARRRKGINSDESAGPGGAIPYASSFSRAACVIQSVVQAGAYVVRISTGPSASTASARRISISISCIAGQPEYVGVIVTTTPSSPATASRTIPSSTT